ncbi:methyltransferase domain-containing protein [Thermodesulfobacteriota bacterium]
MKEIILHLLVCPTCLPREENLSCSSDEKVRDDIITGFLTCPRCNARYPIADGIAFVIPKNEFTENSSSNKYESDNILSSYVWSHFGDLMKDEDANTSYGKWSEIISPASGFALDAGCAVGRFTYEMSTKFDFAIGVDNSKAFINMARRLMNDRKTEVVLNEEGFLVEHKLLELPECWDSKKVEFIVGDIQCLPFKKNAFSFTSSLNLIDRISKPLMHLEEINRVSKTENAQLLFSDPFSWSQDIASEEDWLGGTEEGSFSGKGLDNVSELLEGEGGKILPSWNIKKSGSTWWKIRNHRNHFELIRSCFLKAER